MPAASYPYLAFNRGLISRFGLSRLDIARQRLSAEVMNNWLPRVLGSMMLRPGMRFLGYPQGQSPATLIPFVFSKTDRALLEISSAGTLRIWIDDSLLLTPTATSTVTNGTFDSNLTGWTDNDTLNGSSTWVAGGYMSLDVDGAGAATRDQTVTVSVGDRNKEHALLIRIARGPVILRVGTGTSDDSYVNETQLATGDNYISFTPTGDFNIRLTSRLQRAVLIDSVTLQTGGIPVALYAPLASAPNLGKLRYVQSGDVIFIASGSTPYRIERRGAHSWSIVQYLPEDGPFQVPNVSSTTLTNSYYYGNVTLTASVPYFRTTHAPTATTSGALFKITTTGQVVPANIDGENQFTDAIRVAGAGDSRIFTLIASVPSTDTSVITLQRSFDSDTGPWGDLQSFTTGATTLDWNDHLDNVEVWYRLGVKSGDYGGGTTAYPSAILLYSGGSITGIARVTSFVSSTVVNAEVLKNFGSRGLSSDDWSEGEWSDRRGWPTAVTMHESRLCWAGRGKVWLSATDAFDVFDEEIEGDSAPISRSIGAGPVDQINWLIPLERLIAGAEGAEWSIRSSSLDEPLTPTAFQIKETSTQGSANVAVGKIDRSGLFVQAGGTRVFEMAMVNDPNATDFGVIDLTQLVPEIGEPSIVRLAVQRQPDTRVHCVKSDGTAAILLFDKTENTICWVNVTTGYPSQDVIEDVCVMPSTGAEINGPEDHVYYVIWRKSNGLSFRSIEKWAFESECRGQALNKQADCHVVYSGAATTTLTGLGHLEGAKVVVWADGKDVGTATSTGTAWEQTFTVSGGQIELPETVRKAVVGLPYKAQWKNSKLALAASLGLSLTKRKRVHGLGVVLADTHAQGLFFGRDFTNMDPLPLIREGKPVDPDVMIDDTEDGPMIFPGEWSNDARICLEARAPRPVTCCAIVADTETHEQR